MQFFHPLIRTIQKASYSGIVHEEDKLLGGAVGSWGWEENWREGPVVESFYPVTFTVVYE